MAENSDTRSSQSKKVDEASSSLGQFSKGKDQTQLCEAHKTDGSGGASGNTTSGTNVSASDQIENMQTGQADHLSLGPDLTKKS